MATPSPHYGMRLPNGATQFNRLGAELLQFGLDVDQTLRNFDYQGKDPNLVLARVTALEAWKSTADAKLTALEKTVNDDRAKRKKGRVSYAGGNGGNSNGWYWTPIQNVVFPTAFPAGTVPVMKLLAEESGGLMGVTLVTAPTNTGFSYRIMRLATVPTGGYLHWDAEI